MYNLISRTIVGYWVKSGTIDSNEKEIYEYGIEILISSLFGATLVILAGAMWFSIIDAIVFLIVLIPLRCYCGGYHANSYFSCNLTMLILFFITSLFATSCDINAIWLNLGLIINNILIFIYAPIDNKNKQLDRSDRLKHKVVSCVVSFFISLITLVLKQINIGYYCWIYCTFSLVVILMIAGKIKNRISN